MVAAAEGGDIYAGDSAVLFNAARLEEPARKSAVEARVKMAADIENVFILPEYCSEFFCCCGVERAARDNRPGDSLAVCVSQRPVAYNEHRSSAFGAVPDFRVDEGELFVA